MSVLSFPHVSIALLLALSVRAWGEGIIAPAVAEPLESAARAVEADLLRDQKPSGCWETQFTEGRSFTNPSSEYNTFVPAIIVLLLDPVTGDGPARAAIDRAKAQLTDQIESDGTVRYYGRAGSIITADADDTALVWMAAAAPSRAGRAKVVEILNKHRTPDGLYLTWLASEGNFVGVNPGLVPNPPDIGIQLDVLGLLARSDVKAAQRLCEALTARGGESRLWVYYQVTPLLPILRSDDLRKAGYPVVIPAERRRAFVSGQEDWVRACELIGLMDEAHPDIALRTEAGAVLARLAHKVALQPPLFYHNDLSASVSRYYWSADFGDAIWLRLFATLKAPHSEGGSR